MIVRLVTLQQLLLVEVTRVWRNSYDHYYSTAPGTTSRRGLHVAAMHAPDIDLVEVQQPILEKERVGGRYR